MFLNNLETNLIDELVLDHQKFDDYVYMSIQQAINELDKRQDNKIIDEYLKKLSLTKIPDILCRKKSLVLFRNVATLNYETIRFIILSDALEDFHPVIFEYTNDQFNNRNENKFALGKISLYKGENKKRESLFENKIIINVNNSNNTPIKSITTLMGEHLVDFHHKKFFDRFPFMHDKVVDLSDWLHDNGQTAKVYYKSFLSLFLKHGILLENFFPQNKESLFTKTVVLPAIIEIEKETGLKPIIVALAPTKIEEDKFWLSHQKDFLV